MRELQQAATGCRQASPAPGSAQDWPPELQHAFTAIGQQLPDLWSTPLLSPAQKKALLRGLIDKVVIHRHPRDQLHTRIVWKGGETTTVDLPVPVGSLAELSNAAALESRILALARQGLDDAASAEQLTAAGFRSPMNPAAVLPHTVRRTRFNHQVLPDRHPSHPRPIPGCLTVTQLAGALDCSVPWLYDRIHNGTIAIAPDPATGAYLFPDHPHTLHPFAPLRAGTRATLRVDTAPLPPEPHP